MNLIFRLESSFHSTAQEGRMAYVFANCSFSISYFGLPLLQPGVRDSNRGTLTPLCLNGRTRFSRSFSSIPRTRTRTRSTTSSNSSGTPDDPSGSDQTKKTPFGYTRKDVILIGLGVTFLGIGLKTGLEYVGVDPLQAGNVVQLVLVLGLTVGWISTYIFRVSNKEMTYAQQLRDYESKVMEKRLESLTEAELQALLQEVEEEKSR